MNELIEELINELPSQVACANAREDFANELVRVFLGDDKVTLKVNIACFSAFTISIVGFILVPGFLI